MKIIIKAKQAGRKHALLENREIEIENIGENPSLEDLIKAVVKQQVEEFNAKPFEKNLLPFLSKEQIEQKSESGKIGFGSIYNESKTDITKAQETALQAFEDGMFSVFADGEEIKKLQDKIQIRSSTVFIFIRLTFLAGSYW